MDLDTEEPPKPIATAQPFCLAVVEDLNGDGTIKPDVTGDEAGDSLSTYDEACVRFTQTCEVAGTIKNVSVEGEYKWK